MGKEIIKSLVKKFEIRTVRQTKKKTAQMSGLYSRIILLSPSLTGYT